MAIYIIAEAGVNHNGDMAMAGELIDIAAESGADAVKFQTFKANRLVSAAAGKAAYQKRTTDAAESQQEMLARLELSQAQHEALIAHARARRIEFLSTPFDPPSLEMLVKGFGISTIKIPSGNITDGPFLLDIAKVAGKVILSTGMCALAEVEQALGVLAFGFTTPQARPGKEFFAAAYASEAGKQRLRERVTLLHCTTEYPAPVHEVNLRAMDTMAAAFGLPVGYSDHTEGIHVAVAAAARGACVIEKHFTKDRTLPGPDHRASLEPQELGAMVKCIREVEQALGTGEKIPTPSETKNRAVARKGLVAVRPVAAGDVFTPGNLTAKRPEGHVSPMDYWDMLGRKAARAYQPDEAIHE